MESGGTAARAAERGIEVEPGLEVPALLLRPPRARALLVLAHGAGAGMRHPFLESVAARLAAHGVATLRYEFPYAARGERRPDPEPRLVATVRAACAAGRTATRGLPLFAGGKSMGGRMTSRAVAADPIDSLRGIVFLGFPLHPAGRPGISRADHLDRVEIPLLFLQGDRDALADLGRLRPVIARLGKGATLRVFADADHSFHVRKRSGRTDEQVLDALAAAAAEWMGERAH